MAEGTFLTWEEMQRLQLPPNTAMLIPPPPDVTEVPALAAAPPPTHDWLDDAFVAPSSTDVPIDPELERAAQTAEDVPGIVPAVANLIAVNALLQYAHSSPAKEQDDKKRKRPDEPDPEKE